MEHVSLIDVARSWIYNPKQKRDNKWEPRKSASIIRVIPRFVSIPPHDSDKWIDFYFSELLFYRPFRDIKRDIGHDHGSIISKWDSFKYNARHTKRTMVEENVENANNFEIQDNELVQRNTIEHD